MGVAGAAGLRREEVALLANVSVTYYTYLEQGRPVRPSAQVLDALAAALRMSAAERRYLHVLAYGPGGADGSGPAAPAPPERLDPAVADLVQRLEPFPAWSRGVAGMCLRLIRPRASCSPTGRWGFGGFWGSGGFWGF